MRSYTGYKKKMKNSIKNHNHHCMLTVEQTSGNGCILMQWQIPEWCEDLCPLLDSFGYVYGHWWATELKTSCSLLRCGKTTGKGVGSVWPIT